MTGWKSPKRTKTPSFRSIRWRLWLGAAIGGSAAVMIVLAVMLPLRLIFGIEFAPEQVADYIIENSNPNIALALQSVLGAFSLPSAVLGGIMFVAGLGMIVGVFYRWIYHYSRPAAIILACAATPILVRTVFPNVTQFASSPLLLTGFVLDWLLRDDLYRGRVNVARRQFLERITLYSLGGIALAVIYAVPTILSESSAKVLHKFFDFFAPLPRQDGFSDIPGLAPEITPVADFYKMRKSPTPIPGIPANWRLQIDGLVESPLTLTFADLLDLPRTDVYLTRQCISNPVGGNLISTALMSGVSLKLLLDKVGVQSGAAEIVFYGRDGYSENIDLEYGAEHGMITYAMNGEGLPEAHGAPARVEMIGMYGFKSLKWLDRIEIMAAHAPAIWEQQGYTATPLVKTMSRIDAVNRSSDNSLQIAGIAFAGTRGISRVEVQVNDGDWQEAILNVPPLSDFTWVQWRADATVSGETTVTVRAVDGEGQPQIEDVQPQKPNGASGFHQTKVTT